MNPAKERSGRNLSPWTYTKIKWDQWDVDTDDPHKILKASINLDPGIELHLVAFEVTYDEKGGQIAVHDLWQPDLEFLQSQQEGQVQTFHHALLDDAETPPPLPREWTVLAYPYAQ